MGGLAIASAAAPVLGGVIGNMASSGDRDAAQSAYAQALEEINAIGAPPDLSREIFLEKFQQAGVLTPEIEQAVNIQASEMKKIQVPSQYKAAQEQALAAIQERGKTGFSAEDRANLNKILGDQRREAEAKRAQILQGMAQRGMGGSGAELIAQLQASQAADEGASQRGVELSGQASRNALEAMLQSGQLAGNIRGQEFSEQSTVASAEDAINKFRAANLQGVTERNVGRMSRTQELNLAEKQRIMDSNVAQANAEKRRQLEAKRQNWLDRLDQAGMKSRAQRQRGGDYEKSADRTAQQWSSIGSGVGGALGAASASRGVGGGGDNNSYPSSGSRYSLGGNRQYGDYTDEFDEFM